MEAVPGPVREFFGFWQRGGTNSSKWIDDSGQIYFTNLDFPEIRGFPLLNHHVGWKNVWGRYNVTRWFGYPLWISGFWGTPQLIYWFLGLVDEATVYTYIPKQHGKPMDSRLHQAISWAMFVSQGNLLGSFTISWSLMGVRQNTTMFATPGKIVKMRWFPFTNFINHKGPWLCHLMKHRMLQTSWALSTYLSSYLSTIINSYTHLPIYQFHLSTYSLTYLIVYLLLNIFRKKNKPICTQFLLKPSPTRTPGIINGPIIPSTNAAFNASLSSGTTTRYLNMLFRCAQSESSSWLLSYSFWCSARFDKKLMNFFETKISEGHSRCQM